MFVDSHCHLDFPGLAERLPEVLDNMRAQQVTHALCISVELDDFPKVLAVAESADNLYASVGTHPDYEATREPSVDELVVPRRSSARDRDRRDRSRLLPPHR